MLLVTDSLDVGGAERHVCELARALSRRGYAVTVACSVGGSLSALVGPHVAVRPLLNELVKRKVSQAFARKLAQLIRQEPVDLVHAHMYASAAAAAIAAEGAGVPLVLTEHSEASWRTPRARWYHRRIYDRAAHLIAVSSGVHRRLVEQDGVAPERATIILNALPPAPPPPPGTAPPLPVQLRAGPRVGVVARLQPEKGVAYFLQAAAEVARRVPEASFLVVGDGPIRDELTQLAERLGVRERVHFLGFRLDAPALIGMLDVLVLPSLNEGSPLVILEAMAAGVPAVASAVGGVPEQIRHEREGLLVPPAQPAAMADAVVSLLQDPARARRLGEASRRRVNSRFSHAAMIEQIEGIYRAVLRRPASRGARASELA